MTTVGGILSEGWRQAGAPMTDAAPGHGAGPAIAGLMVLLLVVAMGALALRGRPRGAAGGLAHGHRLDAMRVAVGPWPGDDRWPAGEVQLMLLRGGPLPVEVDGEIRWMADGDLVRVGPAAGCARHVRPLRTSAVWMSLATPGARPVRRPAVRP